MMRAGLAAVLVLCATGATAQCRDDRVEIRGAFGSAGFSVELAETADTRARGLMYRETMSKSAGMLFIYPDARPVSFWMQNTLIPLDMIFVGADGVVTHVHENAIPHDETGIDGGQGVQYVLEINGGLAKRLGIAVGSELRHPQIVQTQAVWPCEN